MNILTLMPTNTKVLYRDGIVSEDTTSQIYVQKSYCETSKRNNYHFLLYTDKDGEQVCQGYIYFNLNDQYNMSKFIGMYVKPEYRNKSYASLLISTWLDFCLNNGYEVINTQPKQKKPFMIYLLKTYGFELLKKSAYDTNPRTIDIIRVDNDPTKYLHFRTDKVKDAFIQSKIAQEDNYSIIDTPDDTHQIIDQVLPLISYKLDDSDRQIAEQKAVKVLSRFKK